MVTELPDAAVAAKVDRLARRLYRRVRHYGFDLDDLRQEGHAGALFAMRRFDPSFNRSIEQWIEWRAWGAMVDFVRKYDGNLTQHHSILREKLYRDRHALVDDLRDQRPRIDEAIDDVKRFVAMREAVRDLPMRLQAVYHLLYIEELTMREAGERLGVSESRICQIVRQIETSLKDAFNAHT